MDSALDLPNLVQTPVEQKKKERQQAKRLLAMTKQAKHSLDFVSRQDLLALAMHHQTLEGTVNLARYWLELLKQGRCWLTVE
jgi:hypothetical protein